MKNIIFISLIGLIASSNIQAQMTGPELLDKAIKYHDPKQEWGTKALEFQLVQSRPDGSKETVDVSIDLKESMFKYLAGNDTLKRAYEVTGDQCQLTLNGSKTFSAEMAKKHRMTCDFGKLIRNYTIYLWGLPMKLKDPGTIVHKDVKEAAFEGVDCYQLKVTYEETVGKDTWYFYFKKSNYALHGYKFYKDESKNDGEYITLEGEEKLSKMRIPKARKWYYNKDGKYLGEDVIQN